MDRRIEPGTLIRKRRALILDYRAIVDRFLLRQGRALRAKSKMLDRLAHSAPALDPGRHILWTQELAAKQLTANGRNLRIGISIPRTLVATESKVLGRSPASGLALGLIACELKAARGGLDDVTAVEQHSKCGCEIARVKPRRLPELDAVDVASGI